MPRKEISKYGFASLWCCPPRSIAITFTVSISNVCTVKDPVSIGDGILSGQGIGGGGGREYKWEQDFF